jgi:hypothetical protein
VSCRRRCAGISAHHARAWVADNADDRIVVGQTITRRQFARRRRRPALEVQHNPVDNERDDVAAVVGYGTGIIDDGRPISVFVQIPPPM